MKSLAQVHAVNCSIGAGVGFLVFQLAFQPSSACDDAVNVKLLGFGCWIDMVQDFSTTESWMNMAELFNLPEPDFSISKVEIMVMPAS